MYVCTPRVFVNLAAVASATRTGNVVKLILNTPTAPHLEVNHPDDAEQIWKALGGWATTQATMGAKVPQAAKK